MRKRLSISLFVLLGVFGFVGCDDSHSSVTPETPEPEANLCDPPCTTGESCVEGVCQCGGEVCKADEVCTSGQCEKKLDVCTEDCEMPAAPCDGRCSAEETCVDDVCQCGDTTCTEHQTCKAGNCEDNGEDYTHEEIPICEPECKDDEYCNEGECVPFTPSVVACNPECDSSTEYCDDNGNCQKMVEESCNGCTVEETCVSGVCMCGKTTCNEDEYCKAGGCEAKDPCAKKECAPGEACVDGNCKAMPVSFQPAKMDVLLSSVSEKLVATNTDDSDLVWLVAGKTDTENMSGLRCWTKDKKVSSKLSECIIKDKSKKTETVQFLGFKRHLGTVTVTVENAAKAKAEATLTIKPYFDMDNFVYMNNKMTAGSDFNHLIYRNGYTAGANAGDYTDKSESETERIANLGGVETTYGPANPYGKQIFTDEELDVIDKDMYMNYVRPHLLKKDGSYYGTRASVVAAARFLILQFPYDIPYTNGSGQYKKARSHYVFTDRELKSKLSEVGIFGLNLNSNVYSSAVSHDKEHIIRTDVVPWGAAYDDPAKTKNPYNGLECSGFVTWALKNGLVGLGDWQTLMFAKSGDCKIDGKIVRNYRCKELVNNDNNKNIWSNTNNRLTTAYAKMSRLNESDFIKLNNQSQSALQTIFKEAKAGDLLWKGTYKDVNADTYRDGHVAMIIGIKRDSEGLVKLIEIGEAVGRNGNKLTKYTSIEDFAKGHWVTKNDHASFLIKMDNVYNYYSDTKEITTESAKSDCPDGKKSGGNCYMYTDMYNEAFNYAILNKTL